MLTRDAWLDLTRKLDWDYSYVTPEEMFPRLISGEPWLDADEWKNWEEPYRTSYTEYVMMQADKEASVTAVREVVGKVADFKQRDPAWNNILKLHAATFTLAEFAAVVGNLRAARFGRDSAWRNMALFGALDELRHTQIPLQLMHEFLPHDEQFDWTHRFYHTNNWVAVAGRHMVDELLLMSNPIEFAIATNFVFETGFTNLQFLGLSSLAHNAGDRMFEKMLKSIQTDEARHAQIGPAVLAKIVQHNKTCAQQLLDKWFWRSWQFFAVVTGFSMDYLTPLKDRTMSFKEFMEEWIVDHFLRSLKQFGLEKPWYWNHFLDALDSFHHMAYAAAYSYRSTVWFNFVLPSPEERAWLRQKYPKNWDDIDPIWSNISAAWSTCDPGLDLGVHGTAIVSFCDLCQIVLCGGTPKCNAANTMQHDAKNYIFCSEPCRWIFSQDPERYANHKDIVKRVLAGEAPGNVLELITQYFDLTFATWGKDVHGGNYPWLERKEAASSGGASC